MSIFPCLVSQPPIPPRVPSDRPHLAEQLHRRLCWWWSSSTHVSAQDCPSSAADPSDELGVWTYRTPASVALAVSGGSEGALIIGRLPQRSPGAFTYWLKT